jgi:hypothetical protein
MSLCPACCNPAARQHVASRRRCSSSDAGGWNHHLLQCTRPQLSRQQLRPQPPPQRGPAPQAPQPGPQPGPQPPPRQCSRPQRSRQQRRRHCTSVTLSMPAVAAVGSGRIGAAWVVPTPPANTRPTIPTANNMRNICVHPIFQWLICSSSRVARMMGATDQLKNGPPVPKLLR